MSRPAVPLSRRSRQTFERDGQRFDATITPRPADVEQRLFGVARLHNRLLDIRDTPRTRGVGLRKEDRLLALNGQPIYREYDLARAMSDANEPLVLRVERDGAATDVTLSAPIP